MLEFGRKNETFQSEKLNGEGGNHIYNRNQKQQHGMKKYNWITDNLKKTSYFYMPYGSTVIYTVRSTDNQNSWIVYD